MSASVFWGRIVGSGACLTLGYGSLWFFQPLRENVSSVLFLFFLLFLIYLYGFRGFRSLDRRSWVSIFLFSLLFRLILLPMTPSLSDDAYRYAWDGRVQRAGINPYVHSPDDPQLAYLKNEESQKINHPHLTTIYPPLSQAAFKIGSLINPKVIGQKIVFFFSDIFLILILLLLLKKMGKNLSLVGFYAWHPAAVIEFSGSGHNDVLMLALLFAAFWAWEDKRRKIFVGLFSASILAKAVPLIGLPWALRRMGWTALLGALLVLTVGAVPYIPWKNINLGLLTGPAAFVEHWRFNETLFSLFQFVGPDGAWAKKLIAGVLLGLSFYLGRVWKNPMRPMALLFLGLLLLSPVVHPWYVLWLAPFSVFIPWKILYVFPAVVYLSYFVLPAYLAADTWVIPLKWKILEVGVIFSTLFYDLTRWSRRLAPPPRAPSPPLTRPFVSVVIPARNEERALRAVLDEIPKNVVSEIIVADNGSTDGTAKAARERGAKTVWEPRMGYGQAVQAGLKNLDPKSDIVVVLDGDHADYPEDLPLLLEPILSGRADFVIGARGEGALPRSLTPHQKFGNALTCFIIQLLFGFRYSDMGPFRAIRTQDLKDMKMEDLNFGWNVEMQVKALQLGLRIEEARVRYRPRIGKSKISGTIKGSISAGVIILFSILRYGFLNKVQNDLN